MQLNWKIILGGAAVFLGAALVLWFLIFHSSPAATSVTNTFFGFGGAVSNVQNTTGGNTNNQAQTGSSVGQKVFEIAAGPVAGAVFMVTPFPTTTIVRYARADNGHVLDMPIDVPGAVARPVSNTTIPGVVSDIWSSNGTSTLMQYVDAGVVKTLYMEFAAATATSSIVTPKRILFLPQRILSLAISPDNTGVAYLIPTSAGVDGYTAHIDGTGLKKLFSIPLTQVTLSWPSQSTLLLQTKSAAGVPGIVLSANAKTGAITPLLFASGIEAIANADFSKIVYQTANDADGTHEAYSHDMKTGQDLSLPFNPFPEKCVWSSISTTVLYCAAPSQYVTADYLDAWHQGLAKAADSIFTFDIYAGATSLVVTPGSGNTAPLEPIQQMATSPDGHYLLFITRGDQSLWGVRLY